MMLSTFRVQILIILNFQIRHTKKSLDISVTINLYAFFVMNLLSIRKERIAFLLIQRFD